ncbi:hypothetical protein OIDMADRAFT_33841 [Oidiodendron maius Zn]|uniref:Apple domain-containing protein n=1 Tax=Oidiodendron maius (strain Zn) TaxID=913774 RepID=A0A0C3CA22_OIDMZ|nr:hypothetical protein OIDMADRAFT_33841 [Oidiodendron maius Zn]
MPSFTSIVAIVAALSVASASPLAARDACGVAPTGTATQAPLAEPADIETAALCMAQCAAKSDCECILFGLVDNINTCELFSVPASSIPPVTGLVAYDVACTNVPTTTPTPSNPNSANPASGKGGKRAAPAKANNGNSGTTQPPVVTGATHASPKNGIPKTGQAPLATPKNIANLNACLAACKGNPSCISYTFISGVCNLFA